MIIKSKNFVLKIEEILKDDLPTQSFNEDENFVLDLIKQWHSPREYFIHQTSGSTGRPKKIEISRKKIEISTRATQEFIDPDQNIKSSLLCLDPKYIGGAMVIYRALMFSQDLTIIPPSSNPVKDINQSSYFDIVSMAPIQFNNLTKTEIEHFGIILIGGAPMPTIKNDSPVKIYSTFGMTETVSHIALRELDQEVFKTTGDTIISVDDRNSLKIKGAITKHSWLETNDLIEFIDDKTFKWVGRTDFIINSGGIKINPETVERILEQEIEGEFMIGSLPDLELGRKLILIATFNNTTIDFSILPKYHKPKDIYFNQKIFRTNSGKLDRLKTQRHFEENL